MAIELSPFHWIGIVGILIYGILLIYTLYRLLESISVQNRTLKYFNYKVSFHFVFLIYCSCETTYYSSILITGKLCAWGYSFHMVSLLLNVVYFAMVVNLWGYTLDYSNYYHKFSVLGGITNFVNLIATVVDLTYLSISGSYDDYSKRDILSVTTISIHVVSLLAYTITLLIYGFHIKSKLSQSHRRQTINENELKTKLQIILRINSVLNICCLCYLIRVTLLCWVIYDTLQFPNGNGVTDQIPLLIWFALTGWTPTVGPAVIFLYIMKTTKVTKKRSSNFTSEPEKSQSLQDESSRYSWYYEENNEELSQDRPLSISHRFQSVEGGGLNPIALKGFRNESTEYLT